MTTHRFKIERTINAFHGTMHVHIAPQLFSTEDDALAKFLRRYPGAVYLGSEDVRPAPPQPGQFPLCPQSPAVLKGGISVAGAAEGPIKPRR